MHLQEFRSSGGNRSIFLLECKTHSRCFQLIREAVLRSLVRLFQGNRLLEFLAATRMLAELRLSNN